MSKSNGHDPIKAAVAAAEQPPAQTLRQWGPVTISSTGRLAAVGLPPDATDGEIAEVAGWLLTQVLNAYRAERAAKHPESRILVPAHVRPLRPD